MDKIEITTDVTRPELIFGLVGPIGVNMDEVQSKLTEALREVEYSSSMIHVTQILGKYGTKKKQKTSSSEYQEKISLSNSIRRQHNDNSVLAAFAVLEIREKRSQLNTDKGVRLQDSSKEETLSDVGVPSNAYIIRQLKRKEEVDLLRKIYGRKFIQVSVTLDKEKRIKNLTQKFSTENPELKPNECESKARNLVIQDENEEADPFGQRISDVFHLGDVFLSGENSSKLSEKCRHFIHALFGDNSISPTKEEFGSYMAKAASLRSIDLSRQVGAAIFSHEGDMITVGCNEVPKSGGGNYWCDDPYKERDIERGVESNKIETKRIVVDFVNRLKGAGLYNPQLADGKANSDDILDKVVSESLISGITEYGRMTHAEMSAICDAARLGRSIKNATIYVTTFPCHNCAKHIIASGITRAVFIEPYLKSRAEISHNDAIVIGQADSSKVTFQHFEGISPRRYRDIFEKGKRKDGNGKIRTWFESEPRPRVEPRDQMHTYRELNAINPILQKIGDQASK